MTDKDCVLNKCYCCFKTLLQMKKQENEALKSFQNDFLYLRQTSGSNGRIFERLEHFTGCFSQILFKKPGHLIILPHKALILQCFQRFNILSRQNVIHRNQPLAQFDITAPVFQTRRQNPISSPLMNPTHHALIVHL